MKQWMQGGSVVVLQPSKVQKIAGLGKRRKRRRHGYPRIGVSLYPLRLNSRFVCSQSFGLAAGELAGFPGRTDLGSYSGILYIDFLLLLERAKYLSQLYP